ncbi:MAG: hypothetical protein WC334_02675 [Kiritimatiellales bacterium]
MAESSVEQQHPDEEDSSVEQSHPQVVFFAVPDLSVEQQHGLEGCFIAFSNMLMKNSAAVTPPVKGATS